LSIINNLLNIFDIKPQYFRIFTLYNCFNILNEFYLHDQRVALGRAEGPNFQKIIDYDASIPPSLIGDFKEFQHKIKELYKYNLRIVKLYLNDSKIFIEQYYMQNQNDINYHNWFLYEQFMGALQKSMQIVLNPRWSNRFSMHPFTILQYYQPPDQTMEMGQIRSNISLPEELKT